jgi:hypothetical protein
MGEMADKGDWDWEAEEYKLAMVLAMAFGLWRHWVWLVPPQHRLQHPVKNGGLSWMGNYQDSVHGAGS